MKKFFSYAVVFVLGIVMSMVGLRAMTGHSVLNFTSESRAKEAVLASLETKPLPMHRSGNDSVVADAAAKLEPAIVDVHTVGKAVRTTSPFGFGGDPIFRHMFGDDGSGGGGETVQPKGAGSGVIISPAGYILTNNHVVADTETVTVTVGDKGYTAKVIGTDPSTDIAVVKIDPKGATLPVAELGDSDAIRVGDWAIAIGNPLDVGTTVTLGIISALNRTHLHAEGHQLNSVILTDAAINPGNSGGALANINGQVIGINEAILSPTGSSVGIGFAIPINSAKKIAAELIKNGKIVRPYLGIGFGPLSTSRTTISPRARRMAGATSACSSKGPPRPGWRHISTR